MGKNQNEIEIEDEESDQENEKTKKPLKTKSLKKIKKRKHRSANEQKEIEKKRRMQKLQIQNQKILTTENKTEVFKEIMKTKEKNKTINDDADKKHISRGQKKRAQKKLRILKYKSLENQLAKLKKDKKEGTLSGFDKMKRDLEKIEKIKNSDVLNQKQDGFKKTVKRKNIEKKNNEDIERMKTILKFPAFLDNPLSTIKQHIVNTLEQKKNIEEMKKKKK